MIELRFKTYPFPMQIETRFKERFDQLRAKAESANADFFRMFNQGIPDILDGIEQALSTLPEQQEGATPAPKKRGNRWTKPQTVNSGLEDLNPPPVSNGSDKKSRTGDDADSQSEI